MAIVLSPTLSSVFSVFVSYRLHSVTVVTLFHMVVYNFPDLKDQYFYTLEKGSFNDIHRRPLYCLFTLLQLRHFASILKTC